MRRLNKAIALWPTLPQRYGCKHRQAQAVAAMWQTVTGHQCVSAPFSGDQADDTRRLGLDHFRANIGRHSHIDRRTRTLMLVGSRRMREQQSRQCGRARQVLADGDSR